MFDRKVSGGLASPRRPYLWYSNQGLANTFGVFAILMASVTHSRVELPLHSGAPSTVRIEPPRVWLKLRLNQVWQYRELL
jgi:hypothetical protein